MCLLEELKNYLDITWEISVPEHKKLAGMIERGKAALIGKIGDCDFETESQEKTLLFNYVMYERSGALDEFWQNYRGEILSLRIRKRVQKHEKKQQKV